MSTIDETRLLVKVARLYYEQNLTQQEIAGMLRISRPKVSRLLQQARDERIVQIVVVAPQGVFADLERSLEQRFGLKEAVVAEISPGASPAITARELGAAAAEYLCRVVQDGDVLGLAWGVTLAATVDALPTETKRNVRVAQIIGGLGEPSAEVHATGLARRVAQAFGATLSLLPAPGVVGNAEVRKILLSDPHISHALQQAAQASLLLVGIGAPTPDAVLLRDGDILSWEEVRGLTDRGAVGDIALRFFDINGEPIRSEIDERVIGLDLDTLRSRPHVIGVAGGPAKFAPILGAVRGKLINVLVTDHLTAEQLLAAPEHQR